MQHDGDRRPHRAVLRADVAASLASLLIFPQNFLRSMGIGGMAAVLVAMIAALTVLPARARAARPADRRRPDAVASRSRGRSTTTRTARWARLAHSVMRRPVVYLVGSRWSPCWSSARRSSARSGAASTTGCCPRTRRSRVAADFQADRLRRRDLDREHRGRRVPTRPRSRRTPQRSARSTASTSVQPIDRRPRPATPRHAAAGDLARQQPDRDSRRTSSRICAHVEVPGDGTALVGGHQRSDRRPGRARSAPTCPGWG